MNVITRQHPDGTNSHCNAHCYNSTRSKCTCICRSLLHGKGEQYAKDMAPFEAMYLQRTGLDGSKYFPNSELIVHMGGR